ncbi:DUF3265 domain-containing protein [Vreelandella venusta]|nr:DUF3265 domain-containing protein [Halomonas venusta]
MGRVHFIGGSPIRNAWHFYYALILVIRVVCGGFGIALLTP